MSQPKTARIIEVLDRHAHELCFNQYSDDNYSPAHHCLLAWMAVEAGIEVPLVEYNTHVIGMAGTRRFASSLKRAYDLTIEQLKQLQFASDEAGDVQEMKSMVSELARKWSNSPEIAA